MRKTIFYSFILFAFFSSGCRPYIVSSLPADKATEVPGHTKIEARFSVKIDDASFGPSMYYVELDGKPVSGTVSLEHRLAQDVLVFKPLEPLKAGKTYKATAKKGAKNKYDGKEMNNDKIFSFAVDTVKPEIVSTDPSGGKTGSYKNRITITLNEPIGMINYVFKDGTGAVIHCMTSFIGNTVQIRPDSYLKSGMTYTIAVSGFADTAGNLNDENFTFSFTTQNY